jgi:polyisoprenoid-binding protein YceI
MQTGLVVSPGAPHKYRESNASALRERPMPTSTGFSPGILARRSLPVMAFYFVLSVSIFVPQLSCAQVSGQEIVLVLDPAQTKVNWNLDSSLHMVHGTFALKSGTVHFNPDTGKVGGEIVVLATSGQSDNNSRDKRMHKEILETAKYPEAIFRPQQIEGNVSRSGGSDVQLRGIMTLRGADHEITVPVHLELAGDRWNGTTTFPIPYIAWGIKDPSNWLLKAKSVVNVELTMTGSEKTAD